MTFYYTHMPVGFNPPQVDAYAASNEVEKFCDMASAAQVFLPQEVSNNLDSISETLKRISNNLGMRELAVQGGEGGPMEEGLEKEALDLLSSKLPDLSSQLESAFRELLGVER